jgi:hypothetical protein
MKIHEQPERELKLLKILNENEYILLSHEEE